MAGQLAAGHPAWVPKQVFGITDSLMKLKSPRVGFVSILGTTGTGFKTLMGKCTLV